MPATVSYCFPSNHINQLFKRKDVMEKQTSLQKVSGTAWGVIAMSTIGFLALAALVVLMFVGRSGSGAF
jgi:hypothetical protein